MFSFQNKRITSTFGERVHPITGRRSQHNGVDYAVPLRTPITADRDVIITAIINQPKTGGLVLGLRFIGEDKLEHRIAHLSVNDLHPVNTRVPAGEVIAYSGNTGGSTGPHVHHGLKRAGAWVNPLLVASGGFSPGRLAPGGRTSNEQPRRSTAAPPRPRRADGPAVSAARPALTLAPAIVTIEAGDTIWALLEARFPSLSRASIRQGVGVVKALNPGLNVDRLRVGMKVRLPVMSSGDRILAEGVGNA